MTTCTREIRPLRANTSQSSKASETAFSVPAACVFHAPCSIEGTNLGGIRAFFMLTASDAFDAKRRDSGSRYRDVLIRFHARHAHRADHIQAHHDRHPAFQHRTQWRAEKRH